MLTSPSQERPALDDLPIDDRILKLSSLHDTHYSRSVKNWLCQSHMKNIRVHVMSHRMISSPRFKNKTNKQQQEHVLTLQGLLVSYQLVKCLHLTKFCISFQAPDEESLTKLADRLRENSIDHKLWIEQPENIPTCVAVKPYKKEDVQQYFKEFKLFR